MMRSFSLAAVIMLKQGRGLPYILSEIDLEVPMVLFDLTCQLAKMYSPFYYVACSMPAFFVVGQILMFVSVILSQLIQIIHTDTRISHLPGVRNRLCFPPDIYPFSDDTEAGSKCVFPHFFPCRLARHP